MKTPTRETISREEFDRRLVESNERWSAELQRRDAEQVRVERLLSGYENTLDEVEEALRSTDHPRSYPTLLRKRLEELARRTAEVATSL